MCFTVILICVILNHKVRIACHIQFYITFEFKYLTDLLIYHTYLSCNKVLTIKKTFFFDIHNTVCTLHHSFMSLEVDTTYLSLLECLSLKVEKGKVWGLLVVLPLTWS